MRFRILIATLAFAMAVPLADAATTENTEVWLVGNLAGKQVATYEDDGSVRVHFEYNDRGRGPSTDSVFRLAGDGTTRSVENRGVDYFKAAVEERYNREGDKVTWKNASEDQARTAAGPAFYLSLQGAPEELVLLGRALLAAPGQRMALLPDGEARIEKLSDLKVKTRQGRKTLSLYALHGLDLTPNYFWLDDQQRFFASYSPWFSMVREGNAAILPQLGKAQDAEEKRVATQRAKSLTTHLTHPLAIRGARVFDPPSGTVQENQVVLVEKGRISAVGDAETVKVPADAQWMDAGNRFLMPGLWDMHVHESGAAQPVLDIAGGVTTVRDLANEGTSLAARIGAIEAGMDIGPRIIKAGIIDGRGPFAGPTKVLADTADEARAHIAEYARTGYEQVKIYSSLKTELVPSIIEAAHAAGLRVSGHVPAYMTARQFVEAGADEIQHINMLMLNFLFDKVQDTRTPARFSAIGEFGAAIDLGAPEVRSFVQLLRDRGTVVDPTVSTFEDMFLSRPGFPGPGSAAIVNRLPATLQRGVRSGAGGLPIKPGQEGAYRDGFQRMIDFVGVLHRSGVRLVAGTDGTAGLALARELELYVAAGIPPKDVLRIATYDAAAVMKRNKDYGRVAPGYVADLILVDGDPTVVMGDIRKVRTVIRGDRWFDSGKLFESVGVKAAP
ncbi:amidohydrolase family protein [Tahibacter amnicola]|uniref:Amidohydrolase family protein n=1 Tax=Tahibacter amnicola TaxID=2976241 RepID=A0ABY6BFC8_9GAMM|nr:amidohydrolase family protein [Tahibacter amnicola]UXI68520.1 amidohydrolase family protein [Tahibacter amnicola]